jgi:hypothetical protein
MRVALLLAVSFLFGLGPLEAQIRPEELLARAVAMSDAGEPERTVELLRQLLNGLPAGAAPPLRREAHLRLAMTSWSLGLLDSAAVHFQAVVRADPFLRLDPDDYNPELLTAFDAARRTVIAVGVRPSLDTLVDARTGRWQVAVAVSQPGQVRVRLAPATGSGGGPETRPVVLAVESNAIASFAVADSDGLAPGTYRLLVDYSAPAGTAASGLSFEVAQATTDSLAHEPPPADSLFRLEFRWGPRSRGPLLRGVGVGVGAVAIPLLLGHHQLRTGSTTTRALFVGATVSIAGIAAHFLGRPKQLLPENIEYNRALRSAWEERNGSIIATNAARRTTPMLRVHVVPEP